MSDERDPTSHPEWSQLSRRLQATQERLLRAQADYVEACTASQRALGEIIDSFGDLSAVVETLANADAGDRHDAVEPTDPTPSAQSAHTTNNISEDLAATGRQENTLPAKLHSRGVAIPEEKLVASSPIAAPLAATSGHDHETRTSPKKTRPPTPPLAEVPVLTDLKPPDPSTPFSGLRRDARILLTNDGFGTAAALSDILSQEGYKVRVGSRRPDFSAPADTVIFMGSLRAPSNLDDAMSVVDDAIHTVDRMTTRLMQPGAGFVNVIDTRGSFGLDEFDPVSAPYGALLGLTRLIKGRHPGAKTRLIDVDGGSLNGPAIAEILARELLEGGDASSVALTEGARRGVTWKPLRDRSHPAAWLEDEPPPLVYMPGPNAVLATAVERLAIAHEMPVAILRRRHVPTALIQRFKKFGVETRGTDYDLNRLFAAMDFLDAVREHYGPIGALVAESVPANNPNDLASWDAMRPPIDEFNALLAMTINDPLRLLAVGLGPRTPAVVASALRYFARAESLRRNDQLRVRLAHLSRAPQPERTTFDPHDFALTEFLSGASPQIAEARFGGPSRR